MKAEDHDLIIAESRKVKLVPYLVESPTEDNDKVVIKKSRSDEESDGIERPSIKDSALLKKAPTASIGADIN